MQTPFSLRIFVADGDPDGLRIVDQSNWIGKALVFPRALLPQVKARPELAQTGVYLLSLTAVMEPPMFGVMEPQTGS